LAGRAQTLWRKPKTRGAGKDDYRETSQRVDELEKQWLRIAGDREIAERG